MHLPAMMNLMLEHMSEQPRACFLLFCARAQESDLALEGVVAEVSAIVDEPPVPQPLLALQAGAGIEGFFRIEERHDLRMGRFVALLAFERVDVKAVDGQIVVERGFD